MNQRARAVLVVAIYIGVSLAGLGTIAPTPLRAASSGHVEELLPLPGDAWAQVQAMNDLGQVIGLSESSLNESRAVRWDQGNPTELPPLPGDDWCWPYGINNRGDVVGSSVRGNVGQAVIWSGGTPKPLSTPDAAAYTEAYGINNRGDVVGIGPSGPVLWSGGTMTNLSIIPGGYLSVATGINDRGDIFGYSEFADSGVQFWYRHGGKVHYPSSPPDTQYTLDGGINKRGQYLWTTMRNSDHQYQAFVSSGSKVTPLPTGSPDAGSQALGITNDGRVVGMIFEGNSWSAVVWRGKRVVTVNSLLNPAEGWDDLAPRGINNRGQIIGTGYRTDRHAEVLLTP